MSGVATPAQIALGAELGMGPAETERCLLLASMPRTEIDAVTALQLGPDGDSWLTWDEALSLHRMSEPDRDEVLALVYSGENGEREMGVAEALASDSLDKDQRSRFRPGVTASRETGRRRPRGYADWRPQHRTQALLDDVQNVLEEYADFLPLTVRQIFYRLVGAHGYEKTERAYSRLGEHLVRARRARLVPFDAIRDDGIVTYSSRWHGGPADFWDDAIGRAHEYRRDRQAGQPRYVELWCESAGMAPQLANVADGFSVPVFSAGGFASLSAVRLIVDRAVRRGVPTVLLHVGDFDPSGESIFGAIVEDARAFAVEDAVIGTQRVEGIRLALTAAQVEEYDLPTAPAKQSDSRSARWIGGTCQLEALPPDTLARTVRDALDGLFEPSRLCREIELEARDRTELLRALPAEGEAA